MYHLYVTLSVLFSFIITAKKKKKIFTVRNLEAHYLIYKAPYTKNLQRKQSMKKYFPVLVAMVSANLYRNWRDT